MIDAAASPDVRGLMRKAVRIVGSQGALAKALGCSQQRVSQLCKGNVSISAEDALAIHRLTGGRVPASELRPDIWAIAAHVPDRGVSGRRTVAQDR
jgi:DNA-binding transcriptional regulator YdaS (Cro superfamily)